ncbi:PIR protein, putative [Plasmodium sp. gorilla clade G1]|nr:PIR protein, putative [Plasmodium sp. gorilla clade G1]
MNLHYNKILLFSFSLNILVLSSYEHNKYKQCIIPHTRTTTSRLLSECDLYMANCDNDPDMKSVKENFDRQTSQRFEEYEERMITNRQKYKEQRDKDIQQIILKDKIDKSLEEKVEKGFLICGCGLGGVAASVGIIGPIVINELKKAALLAAESTAIAKGAVEGKAAGDIAGAAELITRLKATFYIDKLGSDALGSVFTSQNYNDVSKITHSVFMQYQQSSCQSLNTGPIVGSEKSICTFMKEATFLPGDISPEVVLPEKVIRTSVETMVSEAESVAAAKSAKVTTAQTAAFKKTYMDAVQAEFNGYIYSINASVIAILIIVLVMVIIYLILRYRRKKK